MLIGDLGSTPTAAKSPTVSQGHSDFPYIGGLSFSAAILKMAGWAALPGVFENRPFPLSRFCTRRCNRSGRIPKTVVLPSLENCSAAAGQSSMKTSWENTLEGSAEAILEEDGKTLAAAWTGPLRRVREKQTRSLSVTG